MDPPPPHCSETFNDPGNPTEEGIPLFTLPPRPPPPALGAGSLPNNGQQQPSNTPTLRPIDVFTSKFGLYPLKMKCPYCRSHIVTQTIKTSGMLTWIITGLCFFLGCILLCWIPFCVDSCLDVEHRCPACKKPLGRFSRISK
uniref:LITAF domain-containing protein n=1 Tax=Meloidogyne enterolobii TaxID=390850 RepID=A0A6V7XQA3_MELEN|nr:unnamed protein product [Meloidogyne enterolobii]